MESWKEHLPADIVAAYDVRNHRNAAQILATAYPGYLDEVCAALRAFKLTTADILRGGGNESEITQRFAGLLRPNEWFVTQISADLDVTKGVSQPTNQRGRKTVLVNETFVKRKYLDGHKIDFVKGSVALDFEWNSKDQTYDRDLYAFSAFFESGAIDVGVLVTRSADLNAVFRKLGRTVAAKYGASTTWMGKLTYRLEAGRGGGCPILVFGITRRQVSGWTEDDDVFTG